MMVYPHSLARREQQKCGVARRKDRRGESSRSALWRAGKIIRRCQPTWPSAHAGSRAFAEAKGLSVWRETITLSPLSSHGILK